MPLSKSAVAELKRIVGDDGVITTPEGRLVYESDMHTLYKAAPDAVVLPRSACPSCRAGRAPGSSAGRRRRSVA
jgi:hypothetical protein